MTTIQNYFNNDLKTDFLLKENRKNVFKSPKLEKIILNIGVKEANINMNKILAPLLILKLVSQQQPVCTKSKKSIANFKLRQDKIIGCKVTLRNQKKKQFLEKLIHILLPQIVDTKKMRFKNRKAKNNITLGIKDSNLFLELENQYEILPNLNGMEINLCCKKEKKQSTDNLIYTGLKIKFQ